MSESATISIYSPSSQMRTPILLLRSIWKGIGESRELSWRLFLRDLSAQYRQSIFGVLWAFAPPIVTGLIFIALRSSSVVNLGETDIPYPVFALVGTMLWQLFTDSLNAPLKSAMAAKPLMAKVSFPHEALIVSAFFMSMFNFVVKSLLILAILLIFGMAPHWTLLAAPAVMLLLILLGITIGLLITPIGMLYTDVASALPIVTLIGLDMPGLLAGAVVTESIFAWPGMGLLFLDHLSRLDYSVLMTILLMITIAVIVFQLITDLAYTWLDPRIRYS